MKHWIWFKSYPMVCRCSSQVYFYLLLKLSQLSGKLNWNWIQQAWVLTLWLFASWNSWILKISTTKINFLAHSMNTSNIGSYGKAVLVLFHGLGSTIQRINLDYIYTVSWLFYKIVIKKNVYGWSIKIKAYVLGLKNFQSQRHVYIFWQISAPRMEK